MKFAEVLLEEGNHISGSLACLLLLQKLGGCLPGFFPVSLGLMLASSKFCFQHGYLLLRCCRKASVADMLGEMTRCISVKSLVGGWLASPMCSSSSTAKMKVKSGGGEGAWVTSMAINAPITVDRVVSRLERHVQRAKGRRLGQRLDRSTVCSTRHVEE